MNFLRKARLPTQNNALPGRDTPVVVSKKHFVSGTLITPPFPTELTEIIFGMGCFWGVEQCFWELTGVYSTAVGYTGGFTPNPTHDEVCSGMTGHNEVVRVLFDENIISFNQLLNVFWENHNPTQGMRQGNDTGTQYRSGIYTTTELQLQLAEKSKQLYQRQLTAAGYGGITTEILLASDFYYADDSHQQYLAKNANGYCELAGLDVTYSE